MQEIFQEALMTRLASFLLISLLIIILLFYIVDISFIILITLFLVDENDI